MSDPNDVFKKLFIDEKDSAQALEKLIDSASKVFLIERPSGRIVFQNFSALTDRQRIAALLAAKHFALKNNVVATDALGISEIAKELSRPVTALSGPVRDLVKQGFLESLTDRKYKIISHRLAQIFENVLRTKK